MTIEPQQHAREGGNKWIGKHPIKKPPPNQTKSRESKC
jgi:hypothetical protein